MKKILYKYLWVLYNCINYNETKIPDFFEGERYIPLTSLVSATEFELLKCSTRLPKNHNERKTKSKDLIFFFLTM